MVNINSNKNITTNNSYLVIKEAIKGNEKAEKLYNEIELFENEQNLLIREMNV